MNLPNKIKLKLPRPHAAQQQVIGQAKRFNVVCCGRRWGKTVLGLDRLVARALQGDPTSWWAPSYRTLSECWREANRVLKPVIADKSESEHRLALTGGGSIEMWSTDSAGDSARGRKYALAVVDEAAMIVGFEQFWQATLRPMLADMRGGAWFLSTPKGMNYFKTLFERGKDRERQEWMSWQMPTVSNPFIDPSEIEAARQDLTESAFSQEFEAAFIAWEGAVFRGIIEAATAPFNAQPEPRHEYVIGVDWGRSVDFTVFCVVDVSTRTMVQLDRSNRVDYAVQRTRLRTLCEKWKPSCIVAEQNSIGQPIIEQLWRDGLPVQPFNTTNASKAQIIEGLALALERGQVRILPDPVLLAELQCFEGNKMPSGIMRYSAPEGSHDDCVMALALCGVGVGSVTNRQIIQQTQYEGIPANFGGEGSISPI